MMHLNPRSKWGNVIQQIRLVQRYNCDVTYLIGPWQYIKMFDFRIYHKE